MIDISIGSLPAAGVDDLAPLWAQLLAHHTRAAPHLAELGAVRSPEESWQLRRGQYLEWLREPASATAFVARGSDGDRPLGYAVVRVADSPGSWQWGDLVGVLETLVVDDSLRGGGVGQGLLSAAREWLGGAGVQVMKISVIAGNSGAVRFYERAGAVGFVNTLVMPVS